VGCSARFGRCRYDPPAHPHCNRGNFVNRPTRALVLAASLLFAACGGGSTGVPPAGGSSPSSPAAAASASVSASSAAPSTVNGGDGAALCGFLTSEVPKLQQAGSTGGAVGELAIDYANWIAADSSRVLPDAVAMDTLTSASCPATRTTVLKIIGDDSFANSF